MKLSPTMQAAVEAAKQGGAVLKRYPGGYWAGLGWTDGDPYFGTTTVDALVARGAARYSDWKEGRNGRFPIEITLTECICPTECDCQNPEPANGAALISNECPIHNDRPEPAPDCPIHA